MARRGRPPNEPTDKEREKVKELLAQGAPVADIAKLLKRSIPNLRKYFSKELFREKKSRAGADFPFKITDIHRQKVVRYIGCKMKPADVARALGCSEGQLKGHFQDEIATGHARARAAVIDALHDQMDDGVIGAIKHLEALTALPDEGGSIAAGHIGKKAAEKADASAAVAAGGRFAPRPGPKLAVVNGESITDDEV